MWGYVDGDTNFEGNLQVSCRVNGANNTAIKLHLRNNLRSRCILWLAQELGQPYEVVSYQRNAATRLALHELKRITRWASRRSSTTAGTWWRCAALVRGDDTAG